MIRLRSNAFMTTPRCTTTRFHVLFNHVTSSGFHSREICTSCNWPLIGGRIRSTPCQALGHIGPDIWSHRAILDGLYMLKIRILVCLWPEQLQWSIFCQRRKPKTHNGSNRPAKPRSSKTLSDDNTWILLHISPRSKLGYNFARIGGLC